jgi:DNA-binding CsgD family transcriptional regulator
LARSADGRLLERGWLVRTAVRSIESMVDMTKQGGDGAASLLSPRELQVLEMASLGLTNPQIGGRLDLSIHGVKFHLASIYRKLGVSNRTEATTVYLRGFEHHSL